MKNSRSVSIFNDLRETKFDVVFLGINLPGALLAYQLARYGKKVALFSSGDFNRKDDFRFTRIFPENVKSVSAARNRLKLASQMMTQSPHLFLQQRMVWLRGNSVSNKLLSQAYNQLAAQDDSEKAGTLKLCDYPEYAFFRQRGYAHCILCREYRYNHSRLMMEWLKAASREGAVVGNYVKPVSREGIALKLEDMHTGETTVVSSEQIVQLTSQPGLSSFRVNFSENSWNNPVRISGESTDYILSQEKNGVRVTAKSQMSSDTERLIKEEFCQLFSLPEEAILPGATESEVQTPVKSDLSIPDFPIEELEEKLWVLFPEVSEWEFPDCWFHEEENRHISRMFEVAQRKFYEAKQTGIDEGWFMELFYRYGPAIDELTEMAFEEMNATRDPHLLWEESIRRYEEKYEWRTQ